MNVTSGKPRENHVTCALFSRSTVFQPRTQASSRYPSYKRRLGLRGNVTSEIAKDCWERD